MTAPKILTIDIETAPLESYTWGIWDQNVGLEQIKTEWSILAYSAKWLGTSKVVYADTGGRGAKKVRDDKPLMKGLWDLLDEADIVVAQNGARFDIKKINSRLIMHGYGPYSNIKIVDTLSVAKRHFGFTSNKLGWMSKYLTDTPKSEHKKFPGFELWKECLADNPAAWAEMKKYNIRDVIATEKLYLKQRPWIDSHPNMGLYQDAEVPACPKCGSRNVIKNGTRRLVKGVYHRYNCKDCGGWSRGALLINTSGKRKSLLV
jgi:predicted RNA-binding Zn-ribbon protein involved in translation (DUF1610 family)